MMKKFIQPTRLLLSKFCDEHDIDSDALDALIDEIEPIVKKHGFSLSTNETISLNLQKFSIQNCSSCDKLMVNRDLNPVGLDKDYVFDNLDYLILDGGSHDNKSLCEECLPLTHRWGHSS